DGRQIRGGDADGVEAGQTTWSGERWRPVSAMASPRVDDATNYYDISTGFSSVRSAAIRDTQGQASRHADSGCGGYRRLARHARRFIILVRTNLVRPPT